jgi:hypothetical protein
MRTEPKMGPDVHVYKDYDLKSKWNSLAFTEEMNFIGLPPNDKVGIVFEVKAYEPKSMVFNDILTLGWAFFPIFVTV